MARSVVWINRCEAVEIMEAKQIIFVKTSVFWDIGPHSLLKVNEVSAHILPPSSGSKNKPVVFNLGYASTSQGVRENILWGK
jgi:hypothetical protein